MTTLAKYIVLLFGVFLIGVGLLMLLKPTMARACLRSAASTNLINYLEITLRMIPAAGLILYAPHAKFPEIFQSLGWFMLGTSVVLYFVPRKFHHRYAQRCADLLSPTPIRIVSPLSMLFGAGLMYAVF